MGKPYNLRFEQQIKKGIMEMLVLELLAKGPDYGYQLLTKLTESPSGFLKVKEGTFYPSHYQLKADRMLQAFWQT